MHNRRSRDSTNKAPRIQDLPQFNLVPDCRPGHVVFGPKINLIGRVGQRLQARLRKLHLLVDSGDTIRALSGAERQSDSEDRENRRGQPTGACPHRVQSSSPEYRGQADGQGNRISFLTSKTVASVRPYCVG